MIANTNAAPVDWRRVPLMSGCLQDGYSSVTTGRISGRVRERR
jgi:hypothetical protein